MNNLYAVADLENSVVILFAITILIVILGLCFLLFLSIRKSILADRAEEDVFQTEGSERSSNNFFVSSAKLTSAMDEFARRYRFDNEMSLYIFAFEDIASIRKSFGQKQTSKFENILLKRVQDQLPNNTMLANVGQDKFAILIRGKVTIAAIEKFVKNIVSAVEKPLFIPNVEEGKLTISINFGVALYPACGSTSKEIFRKADIALYKASQDPSKDYIIESGDLNKTANENFEYYREIREAMRNNEFTCNYQPIVDTTNNRIAGAEVLVRWVHPTLGVLSPAKFLNIMERTGDIVWVGKWELESICVQINDWKAKYPDQDFFISLNLSPRQLIDDKLVEDFQQIIRKYKISANNICLEIVEFALFEKYSNIIDVITKLHQTGFKIAIDDFNLDGNSLSRVSTLPIDIIKLEKNFVETAQNNFMTDRILHMLVDYAKSEHKIIVAEGVENLDVLAEVMKYDISISQGYLFSKPLTKDAFEDYINEGSFKDAIANAQAKSKELEEPENKIRTSDEELTIPEQLSEETKKQPKEDSIPEDVSSVSKTDLEMPSDLPSTDSENSDESNDNIESEN